MHAHSDPYKRLQDLAAQRFGLCWPDDGPKRRHFDPVLEKAGVELETLIARLDTPAQAEHAWALLLPALTTGESFFLRDQGQMRLLESELLPTLIEQSKYRTLNIWSAGCSTGEEPYTLAILVSRVLGDRLPQWRVKILGTDINPDALDKAALGQFSDWSFRNVPQELKLFHFKRRGKMWEVRPELKALVEFRRANLMDPPPGNTFDLVLCRNVLIYFSPQAGARVARQLARALRPGGLLMVAHGELQNRTPVTLEHLLYPGSAVFRRLAGVDSNMKQPVAALLASTPASETPPAPLDSRPFLPSFDLPAKPQDSAPPQAPPLPDNVLQTARQLGDEGRYGEAEEICRQVLLQRPNDTRALFLAAQLAEVQDDLAVSRSRLERILFLDPSSAGACLELAALARRESQPEKARRLEQAALRILRDMQPEQPVEPYGIPARELLAQLGATA